MRNSFFKTINEILNKLRESNNKIYFFGNGAEKCKSILNQTNFQFLEDISCCAAGLSQLAHEAYIKKEFVNLAYFEPNYLKDFIGTQAKNKLYN